MLVGNTIWFALKTFIGSPMGRAVLLLVAFLAWTGYQRHDAARDAVTAFEIGARDPTTTRATHFHATYVRPGWARRMKPLATRGGHHFYKLREN